MASINCGHCGEKHTYVAAVYICAQINSQPTETTPVMPAFAGRDVTPALADHLICDCGSDIREGDHRSCYRIADIEADRY